MNRDPKVDAYIAKAAPFAQPILSHLRALVHETVEGLDEALKWGMPHFLHKGKNLAGMSAFKAHAAFMIHGDGRQGDAMGQFGKITRLEDLPGDNVLKSKLMEAAQRIESGRNRAQAQVGTARGQARTANPARIRRGAGRQSRGQGRARGVFALTPARICRMDQRGQAPRDPRQADRPGDRMAGRRKEAELEVRELLISARSPNR